MTLYEDSIERDTATTSLTYSDNHVYTSPPLILRSYTSLQSSNNSSIQQQHQQQQQQQKQQSQKSNHNYLTELSNKSSNNTRVSIDYIHRLVEQNERRYEQQEHKTTVGHEWQILSQVVDRLFVFIFLISTMLVFYFIFRQAPHLRLK